MNDIRLAERMARGIRSKWPEARPMKRDGLGDYNIYRTLDGTTQRCWVVDDDCDETNIRIALFVELVDAPFAQLGIRMRPTVEPLAHLSEDEIISYFVRMAGDLSTPGRVKKMAWQEATGATRRFANRVPFVDLAGMYFLACLCSGQRLTSRFVDSTIERFRKPSRMWKFPDAVAIEEGWSLGPKPRDYASRVVALGLSVALSQRDHLLEELRN